MQQKVDQDDSTLREPHQWIVVIIKSFSGRLAVTTLSVLKSHPVHPRDTAYHHDKSIAVGQTSAIRSWT